MGAFQTYVSALSPQPVMWFKFDGGTSTTYTDSGTNANNLVVSTALTASSGGKDGGYLNLTTTQNFNDAITTVPAYLNYTFSFWIKRNLPGVGTYTGTAPFGWSATGTYRNTSGGDSSIESNGVFYYKALHGGVAHSDLITSDLRTGQWILITITRASNVVKLYENGVLRQTVTDAGTASNPGLTGTWTMGSAGFGGTGLDEMLLFNYTMTDAQVLALYNHAPAATNINFTTTPATATNGHFPEPVVSTTIGVSYGVEPATASSQMANPSISTSLNFEDVFRIATATILNPTLVIIDNDNVEVVTTITASAQFVEPFNFGGESNISNSAQLMEASAEIGTHNSIVGISTSYPANETTATALFQDPAFVGQGDKLVTAIVLTATALMTTANVSVNPSYFHEIKKINPSLYFNGTTTNYGSTPATISLDNNWVRQADDAPLNYIFYDGNNHSYDYVNTVGGQEQMTISGASVASLLNAAHTNKQWTLEYWFKSNNAGTNGWNDGDSTPNRWVDFGNITIITNDYYATGNPNNPFADGFSITVQVKIPSGSYQITTPNLTNLAPSFNWNHFVLYQTGNTIAMFVNSVLVLTDETIHTPANLETTLRFYPSTNESPGYTSLDEIVYYDYPLTQPIIADHYNYIKNFDPSKIFYAESFDAAAEITETNVIAVVNKTIPATPITASILFVDPLVIASINLSNSAIPLTASANAVEPFFYGDPDVIVNEPPMIATTDIPQNIYRLDTAYYSYVQTNIAPFRYATLDVPNSNLDWGSDNDFGAAAPFTYGGSISLAIDGLSNNSLLTNGINYTTSGLIMKESEHDDNWGTLGKNWHTSFWIKKDHTDTNTNGLRVIANLHSYENNKHLIVYQYNNYLYLQLDDKVNAPQTFQSSVNVNVFDQNKHHIVITSKSDDKIQIYKNKILVLNATVVNHVITTNSASYLAPNTETNNKARFSVGALITPYAETNLVTIPTPSIMYIDEVHWAVTHIAQTGVNSLYNAMPFKVEIEWFADPALSNFSEFVEPTVQLGAGINAAPAEITNAIFVLPTISTEFSNTFNATALIANATAVEPFSIIADNITNIIFNAQSFIAGAMILPAVTTFTVAGNTMYASAKIQYVYPYTDPYRVLILSQQYKQLTAEGFVEDVWVWKDTYTVGDLN